MIGGWLIKVVLFLAVLGFLAVEVGSPLVVAAQADEAAQDVARAAAEAIRRQDTIQSLQAACAAAAAEEDVRLDECEANPDGSVDVTVTKEAFSFVAKNISLTEDFYQVQASASAKAL